MHEPDVSSPHSQHDHESTNSPRPLSPADSQMTNSLYRANATMDELTATLAKVSRGPTSGGTNSEPLSCCCGNSDCLRLLAWNEHQSKLESRLILCAEVGQALLEKHEAYIRRHGNREDSETEDELSRPGTPTAHHPPQEPEVHVDELILENKSLEKKLNTAFINAEIAESSNKALLRELEEARETISQLTINQAKSTGWEARLSATTQDNEDLRQELDVERQRAKSAETHIQALKERCAKLQSEVGHLYDEMDLQKQSRTELSQEILRDARARLEMVQQQQFGHTLVTNSPEVNQVMESLVADNEALKRDVAELQNLLAEAREDVKTMREEVEEVRASNGSMRRISVSRPSHVHTFSWASSFGQAPLSPISRSANQSIQPTDAETRPISPPVSRAASERRYSAICNPRPRYPSSHLNLDTDDQSLRSGTPDFAERKSPRRPLLLLTQSRGIQTDEISWSNLFGPVFRSSTDDGSSATPPTDGRSESSSIADSQTHASTIAAVVDRANNLFQRLSQADARTLSNRLKRQRLAGDVSHLSHATISSILSEAHSLRSHFRGVLEDERAISTCTRRDLRALLSLLREIFVELGQIRVTLNDIILNPSLAPKIAEAAMDPSKGLENGQERSNNATGSSAGGWMAPLSRLFGGVATTSQESKATERPAVPNRSASVSVLSSSTIKQKQAKLVPKLGPALAASTTTVNVEFSGTGVGRSTTSSDLTISTVVNSGIETERSTTPVPGASSSRAAVMGIFAGAPPTPTADPWVFVSERPQRRLRNPQSTIDMRSATLQRPPIKRTSSRLPLQVDAVIDIDSAIQDDEDDEDGESTVPESLLERTLRPRGLSDSSIRSSFLADEEFPRSPAVNHPSVPVSTPISPSRPRTSLPVPGNSSLRQKPYPGSRGSVLKVFSKAFTLPTLSVPAPESTPPNPPSNATTDSTTATNKPDSPLDAGISRATSPRRMNILPSFAHWAATQAGLDADAREEFVGSIRDRIDDDQLGGRRGWLDIQGREI